MKRFFNLSHMTAGFTAVLVGYTSSVIIILQVATAAGASPIQIESWLLTLGLSMGLTSAVYSWFYKMPILTAWSTPGAAMLVYSIGQYEMADIVGAFVVSGFLIFLTGLITPLSKMLARIPSQLGTAMLAAILLPFCIKGFETITTTPTIFLCMFAAYLITKHFVPKYTMLVLLIVGFGCASIYNNTPLMVTHLSIAMPIWVDPHFEFPAIVNLSIPLYLVTMLSQNLPGIAMMKTYDYDTPVKPILIGTGITNIISAPFGGFSVNLAAISAAICMTPSVDSDKTQRYRAVIWAGIFYVSAGVFATTVVTVFLALPKEVTVILAGFALLGTLLMCLQSAFKDELVRESALLTFLITLSGVNAFGVSATLWGLVVGIIYLNVSKNSLTATIH